MNKIVFFFIISINSYLFGQFGQCEPPLVSPQSTFFADSLFITIAHARSDMSIYYYFLKHDTTYLYQKPFKIYQSCTLFAFGDNSPADCASCVGTDLVSFYYTKVNTFISNLVMQANRKDNIGISPSYDLSGKCLKNINKANGIGIQYINNKSSKLEIIK